MDKLRSFFALRLSEFSGLEVSVPTPLGHELHRLPVTNE